MLSQLVDSSHLASRLSHGLASANKRSTLQSRAQAARISCCRYKQNYILATISQQHLYASAPCSQVAVVCALSFGCGLSAAHLSDLGRQG